MWSKLVELSRHLRLDDWLLVGGQMVALHCHVAGVTPGRVTTDVDVLANVVATSDALAACREAARAMNLEPQPSLDGRHQHRFRNDEMILDVLVPDHTPKHLVLRLLGRDPVPIVGGARALQRAAYCSVDTVAGLAEIPIPDLRGALVLKARAWTSDTRDRDRHLFDLAQLSAPIDDPLSFGECLDNKELRALRRVDMALAATSDPWLRIADARRAEAIEAWQTVTAP
ncbi:MAG: nucleotidyl transferase AbiEii/AbiGii toxin family protein [Actinomycetota bacterium]